MRQGERRVVVTGMGVVTPVGNDVPSTWQALLAGKSGGARISLWEATEDFPTRIAAEVKGFDPTAYLDTKEARRFDRYSQFGIAAAEQAMKQAGFVDAPNDIPKERFGVIWEAGSGGSRRSRRTPASWPRRAPGA